MNANTTLSCLFSFANTSRTLVLAVVALAGAVGKSQALPIFTDRSVWTANVASATEVSLPFSNATAVPAGTSLNLPSGRTLIFDRALTAYEVGAPGGWGTWSGGLSGFTVLAATTSDPLAAVTVRGDFSSPVQAYGFEVQPTDFESWSITLGLADGSSEAHPVSGLAGAQFFGWVSPDPSQLAWFEISAEAGALGFAVGRMVEGEIATTPVSDSIPILKMSMLALAALIGTSWVENNRRAKVHRPCQR